MMFAKTFESTFHYTNQEPHMCVSRDWKRAVVISFAGFPASRFTCLKRCFAFSAVPATPDALNRMQHFNEGWPFCCIEGYQAIMIKQSVIPSAQVELDLLLYTRHKQVSGCVFTHTLIEHGWMRIQ